MDVEDEPWSTRESGTRSEPEEVESAEVRGEAWARTVRAPLPRPLRIAVMGVKDGAGCTTTTMGLGAVLADQRQEPVLAIDADRHAGGHIRLVRRLFRDTLEGLSDLAGSVHAVHSLEDLRLFLSPHRSGLMVLANDSLSHPVTGPQYTDPDFARVALASQTFFPLTLVDADTPVPVVLQYADRVVIVSRADPAGLTQAQQTMDRLVTANRPDLVQEAVVVLNHSRPAAGWALDSAAKRALSSRCRGLVSVPRDGHLAMGSTVELSWLTPEAYRAYLQLGALLLGPRPVFP